MGRVFGSNAGEKLFLMGRRCSRDEGRARQPSKHVKLVSHRDHHSPHKHVLTPKGRVAAVGKGVGLLPARLAPFPEAVVCLREERKCEIRKLRGVVGGGASADELFQNIFCEKREVRG